MKRMLVIAVLLGCFAGISAGGPVKLTERRVTARSAQELFVLFSAMEGTFDPAFATLYYDEAVIRGRRICIDGKERVLNAQAADYKKLAASDLAQAKERGDRIAYTDVTYAADRGRTRIRAMRTSSAHKTKHAFSLLVGSDPNGNWLIYEETNDAR